MCEGDTVFLFCFFAVEHFICMFLCLVVSNSKADCGQWCHYNFFSSPVVRTG